MRKRLFAELEVYYDTVPHSAAMNMAIDEALLEHVIVPSIRFYRWHSPALSFGYFGKFSDVADHASDRDVVRRWTGGGIVFHGDDLTYALVIPAGNPVFGESSMSIYEKIHHALVNAFNANGERAELASAAAAPNDCTQIISAAGDRRYKDCFANPVCADVMMKGRKIAGAAQRRTHIGLLQQGSIQGVDLGNGLAEGFARELSNNCRTRIRPEQLHHRAHEIVARKYGTEDWLRKR